MRAPWILIGLGLIVAGCGGPKTETPIVQNEGTVATSLDAGLAAARSANKPLLLVAYKGSSKDIEMMLLSDPLIASRSSKIVTAKVDGAQHGPALERANVREYPAVVVYRPDGTFVFGKKGATPVELSQAIDTALGGS
jgi:hypothetical protein